MGSKMKQDHELTEDRRHVTRQYNIVTGRTYVKAKYDKAECM